jgi:hypothetical protein
MAEPTTSYAVRVLGAQEERFRDFYHYTSCIPLFIALSQVELESQMIPDTS